MISETGNETASETDSPHTVWRLTDTVSIHEVGESQFAVRDLSTKAYFRVGVQEAFLLEALRKGVSSCIICGTGMFELRLAWTTLFRIASL